jgi:branched-chain amino acid transport system permease protein
VGDLVQLVVSGVATGAIYALAALGFTLLWQAAGVINFAQGEFVMLPAFAMLFFAAAGAPLWLAFCSRASSRCWCSESASSGRSSIR